MRLHTLKIRNFRSLEDVTLDKLTNLNVLIGRNNAGKSAVLEAIKYLSDIVAGQDRRVDNPLTALDTQRSLSITVRFTVLPEERQELIGLLRQSVPFDDQRHEQLLNSSFLRQLKYSFQSPPGRPELFHLRETSLISEDNQWAIIHQMNGQELDQNSSHAIVHLPGALRSSGRLSAEAIAIPSAHLMAVTIPVQFATQGNFVQGNPVAMWPFDRLKSFLRNAFFFSPFRHSRLVLPAAENHQLDQDGGNLTQVLHTIHNNDELMFDKIQQFVGMAVPDVGTFQTPLTSSSTTIGVRTPVERVSVRLHDMGGGIEQLLMIATVMVMKGQESTLFLEEPESHLHAGAQRFLLDRLRHDGRQVFITTHSPVFMNVSEPKRLFRVSFLAGRSNIAPLVQPHDFARMLTEVGARNSDLLISDAVVFVEGSVDRETFAAWTEALGLSLEEHNVTILRMGGGEYADRHAPVRRDTLAGISRHAGIPHLFVIDRDERSEREIDALEKQLGSNIHILERRELENYLLVPRAVLAVIRSQTDKAQIDDSLDDNALHQQIASIVGNEADQLYGMVLLKRIRTELGGLKRGFLPRGTFDDLMPKAHDQNLGELVTARVEQHIRESVEALNINEVVAQQRRRLDEEWKDATRHAWLAPGDELLKRVFRHFGLDHDKDTHNLQIAKQMRAEEIPEEIKQLLNSITALAVRE